MTRILMRIRQPIRLSLVCEARTVHSVSNICLIRTRSHLVGERFKIYICIADTGFNIAINEQPFCTYRFRVPPESTRCLIVQGDLQCITQIDHRRVFPLARPQLAFDDARAEFSNDVPVAFAAGHVVVLTAIAWGPPDSWFDVRFTDGTTMRQLFHMNVRFGARPCVVRNAQTEELRWNYAAEERDGEFPFVRGEQFTMAVALTAREFRVAVNGVELCTFAYRMRDQLRHMNGLKVYGQHGARVEVTQVNHVTGGDAECAQYERYSERGMRIL